MGPLFFLIYINDLPNSLDQSDSILFADDTTLVAIHENYDSLIAIGNQELDNLHDWLCANKLLLNSNKTKAIVFRTSRRHLRGPLNVLNLQGNHIEMVDNHIFLGVNFHKNLSWSNQMLRVKSKLQANVGIVSKIRYQITPHIVTNLFQAMVQSHLRYCNVTWCYGNFTLRTSLQAQSNKFLRAGFHLHWRSCVKYLRDIYSLPSLDELSFQLLANTMQKIILGIYPDQFLTFFTRTHHRYLTSSSLASPFTPTFHRFETTKQSLSHRAYKTWLAVPNGIKYKPNSISGNGNATIRNEISPVFNSINKFSQLLRDHLKQSLVISPLF